MKPPDWVNHRAGNEIIAVIRSMSSQVITYMEHLHIFKLGRSGLFFACKNFKQENDYVYLNIVYFCFCFGVNGTVLHYCSVSIAVFTVKTDFKRQIRI